MIQAASVAWLSLMGGRLRKNSQEPSTPSASVLVATRRKKIVVQGTSLSSANVVGGVVGFVYIAFIVALFSVAGGAR